MVTPRRAIALSLSSSILFRSEAVGAVRTVLDKTPHPCLEKYDDGVVRTWVDKHLSGAPGDHSHPQLLLMLGGSGAGKGTFLDSWLDHERQEPAAEGASRPHRLHSFVRHGLDEYLEYIPEFVRTVNDDKHVYRDAADACYPGAAIPAAKLATTELVSKRVNVIYEETGKNLDRIKKRVLPPFTDAGYRVTVVFVDNSPDVAIARAADRFQKTGRFASEAYIRDSFSNTLTSFRALESMETISEAVYCDNSDEEPMRCYAEGNRPEGALVPLQMLNNSTPKYRKQEQEL